MALVFLGQADGEGSGQQDNRRDGTLGAYALAGAAEEMLYRQERSARLETSVAKALDTGIQQVSVKQEEERQKRARSQTQASQPSSSASPISASYSGGGSGYEYEAKMFIYQQESGNNPWAVNPSSGACGLGQALPCEKLTQACALGDYACQDKYFTGYMYYRYGTWANAKAWWLTHGWW